MWKCWKGGIDGVFRRGDMWERSDGMRAPVHDAPGHGAMEVPDR